MAETLRSMTDQIPEQDPPRSRKRFLLWIGLGIAALLLFAGGGLYFSFSQHPVIVKYREWVRFYSSRRELRRFLNEAGPFAPVVFIALQALQVVMAPIPGEATGFLGGLLFGTTLGFLYSSVGLTIGSALAFGLGRWLGLPLVRRLVSKEVYHRFDFLARTGGEIATLVLFLAPGFPKDILCFILGVSPMPFVIFLVITAFGRMPGTWLLSVQGAKVGSAHYQEFIVFLVIAAIACVLTYNYRERIYRWLHRQNELPPERDPGRPE
jgi:uncharacterized membrane protein YdjX (TVP38/TMEM64 family)